MLTFPTDAERALTKFHSATKTIALATIAKRMGAFTERGWTGLEYIFPDDTRIVVTGRGKSYNAVAQLP